jgi:integrase
MGRRSDGDGDKGSRRARGEGSTFYDERKGLYVGVVDLGMVGGRRRRKVVKSKRQADMLRKMREAQRRKDKGLPAIDHASTTATWLDYWRDEVLPGTVSAKTETTYRCALEQWIKPHVGHIRLAQLGPEHVQGMMRALEGQGLSARTRVNARSVLAQALKQAQRWDKVSRNVAMLVERPQVKRVDDALTAEEAAAVLQAVRGERLEALAVLILTTGLRRTEALGLRWSDVDLDAATLTVTKSKTRSGERTIALPAFVVEALKAHRRRQVAERLAARVWLDGDYVFATSVGTPWEGRNVLTWWHEVTERAGVGRRRLHAARHTAATLMLNAGVPLEVVSKTLGHAGLAITADVYAKVRPELQRQAADAMERVLG